MLRSSIFGNFCSRLLSNCVNRLNVQTGYSSLHVVGRPVRSNVSVKVNQQKTTKERRTAEKGSSNSGSSVAVAGGGGVRKSIEDLVKPVPVQVASGTDDINIGAELSGSLSKDALMRALNTFVRQPAVRRLCQESGLNDRLLHQAFISFRRFCLDSNPLPTDLHITFSDILNGSSNVDDLYPHFLKHARQLKTISDLRLPQKWYTEARSVQRKIVFHCGPTNSGKTYQALERFMTSKTGVYCGPLKLLANEVYHKCNSAGVPCDLVTGEERRYANKDNTPCGHVACTVEMLTTTEPYELAVIDEIQMLRDCQRGWAWTRALLGANAQEIHLCGEAAAVDVVKELLYPVGEEVEVRHYKRMSPLQVASKALESFANVRPGDCIVVFNKSDLFNIENHGHEVAVIYGSLPPATKLAQAQKFNDPSNSCKVLVATDAIGMGLNLSIRRVIFNSLTKPMCLQIGGRAGRFGTEHQRGEVTTLRSEDLPVLQVISITITQAGLNPTIEQIEMFAYYLPKATLSNLIDIFVSICSVDESKFFMCHVEDLKFLADMIEHVPLPLKVRYTFCLAPVNRKLPFVCTMFLRFARKFSRGELLTWEWLCGWPFSPPQKIMDLMHLEGVFDLDIIIREGVVNITRLLKNSDTGSIKSRRAQHMKGDLSSRTGHERHLKKGVPSLSKSLIERGLLTPEMLKQLRNELLEERKSQSGIDSSNKHGGKTEGN
ncbi:unnamed protein product [Soboliphyme baturini]|uniref:RNA helicase n=1 Tax=Soboliphyme baturini TaxID=241478 RepID=A0A183IQG9_9BILA|nr:unnamed protein product [Soboliphyme baturini]